MSGRSRLAAASLAALCVLALAGCGDGGDDGTASAPAAPPAGERAGEADSAGASDPRLQRKPKVKVPGGKPPTGLVIDDLITGDGPVAKTGDVVTVQYVGVGFSDGKQFDASWDTGQPFQFQLGGGQVIPGWETGVVGMHVGGRRQLIIPPKLAYGRQGQPPAIKSNETLVFVIDLVRVG